MRYRLTFIAGAVVGYVFGARAGRERYEQLRKSAQRIARNPAVRNTAESVVTNGRAVAVKVADAATTKVGDRLPESFTERVRALRDRPVEDDWGTSNT